MVQHRCRGPALQRSAVSGRPLHIPTDIISSWRVRMAGPVRSVSSDMHPQYGKFQKSTPDMHLDMRTRTLVMGGPQPGAVAQTVAWRVPCTSTPPGAARHLCAYPTLAPTLHLRLPYTCAYPTLAHRTLANHALLRLPYTCTYALRSCIYVPHTPTPTIRSHMLRWG